MGKDRVILVGLVSTCTARHFPLSRCCSIWRGQSMHRLLLLVGLEITYFYTE